MKHSDSPLHVRGVSLFVDDLPVSNDLVHAAVVPSPVAHGKLKAVDVTDALALPGVFAVFTATDIPGQNQIGNIIQDEPLLAEGEVDYVGQPVAVVVARDERTARQAAQRVKLDIEELPAVFDAREAWSKGQLLLPPRTLSLGDVDAAWEACDVVVDGHVETGGQEHLYLETQVTVALPVEKGRLKLICATQSASAVQRIVAGVLGDPMHEIEVEVPRLGGAFGGKEDQATSWACLAALAASKLNRPVKLSLRRQEDMRWTGKRHPYSSDFKIGLSRDGRILAYEVTFYQNGGAAADLSPAVLERSLFHATGGYTIPNVRVTGISCRTNLPPNTAFRGFGAPQAFFVIEAAIHKAASVLGLDALEIQRKNLVREGYTFPYGMRARNSRARLCWDEAEKHYELEGIRNRVEAYNRANLFSKKGVAAIPLCFGISFTSTFLNQASALVHVYTDGSVSVSTAAVEMGQGVKTKIQQVAARTLGIPPERVHVEFTNTTRIANMSPTAASTGADMNGHATRLACLEIRKRLARVAAGMLNAHETEIRFHDGKIRAKDQPGTLDWEEVIQRAYYERVSLSAQAHYATPRLKPVDPESGKGRPFAYHVYGTGIVEVTVDCLRGTARIDAVKVLHDAGQSLNPLIDRGQVEGAVVQGLGWVTLEELQHDEQGRLLTDSLSTYKIPDIHFAPEIEVQFLETSSASPGPYSSKAIGEPPFMYGLPAYFAILDAMRAFNPDLEPFYDSPLTPEKILLALYQGSPRPKPAR